MSTSVSPAFSNNYFDEKYPSAVFEIKKGDITYFKIFDDNRIVIGRKNGGTRWILEGKFQQRQGLNKKRYKSQSDVRFIVVFITEIIQQEGVRPSFDATPLPVWGDPNEYLLLFLEPQLKSGAEKIQRNFKEDIRSLYIEQVFRHEMNHVLTNEYLTEAGELNNFKSELLADIFLLQELNSQPDREIQLQIKELDVNGQLQNSMEEYYKLYLTVISKLIISSDKALFSEQARKLQTILIQPWSGTTRELFDKLMGI